MIRLPLPEDIAQLEPDAAGQLLVQLAALVAATSARLQLYTPVALEPEQLLTVDDAAALLATTPDYLRRHGRRMGLAIALSPGQLRYSRRAILAFIARKVANDAE